MIDDNHRSVMSILAMHGSIDSALYDICDYLNDHYGYELYTEGNATSRFVKVYEDANHEGVRGVALSAYQRLIETAPAGLQDRFDLVCAYNVLRDILIEAKKSGSIGVVLETQKEILKLVNSR